MNNDKVDSMIDENYVGNILVNKMHLGLNKKDQTLWDVDLIYDPINYEYQQL